MGRHRTNGRPPATEVGAAANDKAFAAHLERPPTVTLNQGATRVLRAGEAVKRDELWQGDAFGAAGEVPVYFRLAANHTMVAELTCTLLARALGLPTPQPYILEILPGTLPGSRFAPADRPYLCVATHDIGGTGFAQLLQLDSVHAQQLLREWAHMVPTAAFDEWVANVDRNMSNILFVSQALWLIDHAEAFGGNLRPAIKLHELTTLDLTNKLGDLLSDGSAAQRRDQLALAREWLTTTAGAISVDEVTAHAPWQTRDDEAELVGFLRARLTVTHQLLCQRLGYPQLSLGN